METSTALQAKTALEAKTVAATDDQLLDSLILLSSMDVTDWAVWGVACMAIETEIARRPHLSAEVAAINAGLDALELAEA